MPEHTPENMSRFRDYLLRRSPSSTGVLAISAEDLSEKVRASEKARAREQLKRHLRKFLNGEELSDAEVQESVNIIKGLRDIRFWPAKALESA